jgi:hypothetical protein
VALSRLIIQPMIPTPADSAKSDFAASRPLNFSPADRAERI